MLYFNVQLRYSQSRGLRPHCALSSYEPVNMFTLLAFSVTARLPGPLCANAHKLLATLSSNDASANGSNAGMLTVMAASSPSPLPTTSAVTPPTATQRQQLSTRIRRMGAIRRKVSEMQQNLTQQQQPQWSTAAGRAENVPLSSRSTSARSKASSSVPRLPRQQHPLPLAVLLHPGERAVSANRLTFLNKLERRSDAVSEFSARFSANEDGYYKEEERLKPHLGHVVSRIRTQVHVFSLSFQIIS